jgi:hypothetical protein
MISLITSKSEARACFDTLVAVCGATADRVAAHKASFRTGSTTRPTYFFRQQDFWIMPTDGSDLSIHQNRYWNCFGLGGDPEQAPTRIAIEINHPHEGRDRRITGRFLRSGSDFLLGHTGRIGGGKVGVSEAFRGSVASQEFQQATVDGETIFVVAQLRSGKGFADDVGRFVRAMADARANA